MALELNVGPCNADDFRYQSIERFRPYADQGEVLATGLSSGGYMTTRAATQFDNLVTALVGCLGTACFL